MKTKNIFRMLLVAAALLMGANNVMADEQVWPATEGEGSSEINWYPGISIGGITNLTEGDVLKFKVTPIPENGEHQIQIKNSNQSVTYYSNSNVVDTYIEIDVDANMASDLQNGMLIFGTNLYLNSITRIPNPPLGIGENILWQGSKWLNQWSDSFTCSTLKVKKASAGNTVRLYMNLPNPNGDWEVAFKLDTSGWPTLSVWGKDGTYNQEIANAGNVVVTQSGSDYYIEFPLTAEILTSINNAENIVIQGHGLELKKVAIYVAPSATPHNITYTIDSDESHANFVLGNPTSATAGDVVNFEIDEVDEGWEAVLTATYGNYTLDVTPGNEEGHYSFTMPDADVTVTMTFTSSSGNNNNENEVAGSIEIEYGAVTFSCADAVVIPEGLTAYYAYAVSNNRVQLIEILGGIIPAETGVVLFGDNGTYDYSTTTEAGPTINNNLLVAVTENPYTCRGGNEYVLTVHQDDEGNDRLVFALVGSELSDTKPEIPVGKAYLSWDDNSTARPRYISIYKGGETDGISDVNVNQKNDDAVIYNLRGQRVERPTKGLYIINGKKVVMK